MKYRRDPAEDVPIGNASAETADRHPDDRLLRTYGFTIVSRPKVGAVLWAMGGNIYSEPEAVDMVRRAIKSVERSQLGKKRNG